MKKVLPLYIGLYSFSMTLMAGGIRGSVSDENKEPIPFATIFIQELKTGTTTNVEGQYELTLDPGSYTVIYQYLGYKTITKSIEVEQDFVENDVVMVQEAIVLRNVNVMAGNEDPAYTIMRKAIAKSKFHVQQIDHYEAQVYVKGAGRVINSPFFIRKQLAKEGIDSTFTFVTESISKIKYTRPNTFEEEVVSVRTNGEDNNTSPNAYIFGSFYQPDIGGAISPLSPKAFAYYRFEYMGTFRDRDYDISKIRVIPRSKGEDVFEGVLNIVEDYWSIHSLDLTTIKFGFNIRIRQIYNPIEKGVWLPVSHQFNISGSILGIELEYNYLATVSDYDIELNPDLAVDLKVIDENIEKDLASKLSAQVKNLKEASAQEQLVSGKEITRKDLRKLINQYDKEERKKSNEPRVLSNYKYHVDSLAANSDSSFWVKSRPVPLTDMEELGYKKMDSMAVVNKEKELGDTLRSGKRKGFHLQDLALGNTYKVGDRAYLTYYSPLISLNFNSVEGYHFNTRLRYRKSLSDKQRFEFSPTMRYSFSRNRITGKAYVRWSYNRMGVKAGSFTLAAGRYIRQFNDQNPIEPVVNSLTTLFWKNNFMKIYEARYLKFLHQGKLFGNLGYTLSLDWSNRFRLRNNTNISYSSRDRPYSSNDPANLEQTNTIFPKHDALVGAIIVRYQPWLKYRIRGKRTFAIKSSSPTFQMTYRKGILSNFGEVDFEQIEGGIDHRFRIGYRGRLGIDIRAGKFLNTSNLYFMDFKHFNGNESPFLLNDPVGNYRLLSYYKYSTKDKYISGFMHYQFRKFLITQFPLFRFTGVKEIVFLSYLGTPTSQNYFELGYGFDNLFRIFRFEVATSFVDGRYQSFGVRIGLATSITVDDNGVNMHF